MTDLDEPAPVEDPRHAEDLKLKVAEAYELAKESDLRITNRNEVYKVFRNTIPKLTFIGQAVDGAKLLAIVKRAAGSSKKGEPNEQRY